MLSIPCDKFYCRSHFPHQSHISVPLQTTLPTTMQRTSASIDVPQFSSALLSIDSLSSISSHSQYLLFRGSSAGLGTFQFPLFSFCAPLFDSTVYTPISALLSLGWELPNTDSRSSVWVVARRYFVALSIPTLLHLGRPPHGEYSFIPISARLPRVGAPLPGLALCDFIVQSCPPPPLTFDSTQLVWKRFNPYQCSGALVWHSSLSFCTPATQHLPSGTPLVHRNSSPVSSHYIILPWKLHC
jgi:hypothetical protein